MKIKKLAVLLPTYNAAQYIKESIDSVLNQSFGNFDLFIYDDFSTDDTEEIISHYKDTRLFYRKNTSNFGIAKTLNKGLDELLPHYEYIARMDADDLSHPERFGKQLAYLDKNREIILCGTQGYWLKDLNQNPSVGWEYPADSEYIKYYLLFAATFGHSSVVFRSQSIASHNLRYDETITTCEDWELWVRISKIGKMANLPDFLMKYRILENSNHRSPIKIKKHFEERSKIISGYWSVFNIALSPEQVFEFYYDDKVLSKSDFLKKIKLLISVFNTFQANNLHALSSGDTNNFCYMLARRLLDYWKRSKVSRFDPEVWVVIVKKVTFIDKIKLLRSILR
ncbi:glycosyltransferase family 2 protein [Flavobacterium sp. WC2429]|uniref:Glycosyltransferase family 2 protein n=1 Tax=Flavobacterium sp. WC2429 TaxID=3234140 RepID=A0AB39WPL8_9FLAO